MVLVLIAIAAMILAGIARHSLGLALEASDARQSLQDRWATVSLERAVLGRVDKILTGHIAEKNLRGLALADRYPASYSVRLGNLDYELLLDEESRKLNMNGLSSTGGRERVLRTLGLLGQSGAAIWLRPQLGQAPGAPRLESWGQVFRLEEFSGPDPPPAWLMGNTHCLTCWGDGRLHFRKADDRVLQAGAELAVGPVTAGRLVNLRRQSPNLKLEELLDQLALKQGEKLRLRDRLTDRSACYSLWLTRKGTERTYAALLVAEKSSDGSFRTQRFTW